MSLEILYQDDYLVAINKPHGLLVHPSPLARDAKEFAMQMLRDMLGQHVHPTHRLDRKTGGVLLFALDQETDRQVKRLFADNKVSKTYLAVVRGYTDDNGNIDYPLKKENGTTQAAITHYKTLARTELSIPFGKHSTVRYSLVEARPQTGRMHQIRKHFAHILHPIIGDRPHGCNKQNRFFKEKWEMETMLLHASSLAFEHPVKKNSVVIYAPLQAEFLRMKEVLGVGE